MHRLDRLDTIALLAELGLLLVHRARLGSVISRPLVEGRVGAIYRFGVLGLGIGAPLLLQARTLLSRGKTSRLSAGLTSALVLTGGFLFRYVIVIAGRDSADDPKATFEMARGKSGEDRGPGDEQ